VMRIISRQPEIDHRLSPYCGPRALACNRPLANRLAQMMAILVLSALVAHSAAAEKGKSIEKSEIPSWYTQTLARGDAGLNVTSLWSLKSKFRAETVTRGHKLVTIVNGDTYYVYDATTMTGIAIRRAPAALAAEIPDRRPFGNEAQTLIDQGGEKIREESIAGRRAEVYQITDDNGRRIVWAAQDDQRLPIHMEFFNRKSGITRYKDYAEWVTGFPVADAFFEPEPGIQFERFELDEYIESTHANNPTTRMPILYQELLHGPAPR
jgi:outer membrane lipoprotein-sorting protein